MMMKIEEQDFSRRVWEESGRRSKCRVLIEMALIDHSKNLQMKL